MYVSQLHRLAGKRTSLSLICSSVHWAVVDSLQTVISNMKFNPYSILQKKELAVDGQQLFSLALACTICCLEESDSHHLMKVVNSSSSVECLKTKVEIEIEERQTIWFCEVRRQKYSNKSALFLFQTRKHYYIPSSNSLSCMHLLGSYDVPYEVTARNSEPLQSLYLKHENWSKYRSTCLYIQKIPQKQPVPFSEKYFCFNSTFFWIT